MYRTLNLGSGSDPWGTDKLDLPEFDFNKAKKLNYPKNTFDEIRLYYALNYMINPQLILNECYRVLKPRGKIEIKNSNVLNHFTIQTISHKKTSWKFYSFNDGQTIKNRLEYAGFKTVSIKKFIAGMRGDILVTGFK